MTYFASTVRAFDNRRFALRTAFLYSAEDGIVQESVVAMQLEVRLSDGVVTQNSMCNVKCIRSYAQCLTDIANAVELFCTRAARTEDHRLDRSDTSACERFLP